MPFYQCGSLRKNKISSIQPLEKRFLKKTLNQLIQRFSHSLRSQLKSISYHISQNIKMILNSIEECLVIKLKWVLVFIKVGLLKEQLDLFSKLMLLICHLMSIWLLDLKLLQNNMVYLYWFLEICMTYLHMKYKVYAEKLIPSLLKVVYSQSDSSLSILTLIT